MSHATAPDDLMRRDVQSADDAKELICRIGRLFYGWGWVTGTGGGMSIRHGERIFMAPSGVQKEALRPEDIFELDAAGEVVAGPDAASGLRVSQCRPLFLAAYRLRSAGAVLHSHSMWAMLSTLLDGADPDHFRITHIEMLKGMAGVGYRDVHAVPIIDNTAHECDLAASLEAAIADADPHCHAVLVRRHGVYVWGDTWLDAKRHAECYDYLFQAAVEMRRLGLDPAAVPTR